MLVSIEKQQPHQSYRDSCQTLCTTQRKHLKNIGLVSDRAIIKPSYALESGLLLPINLMVLVLVSGLLHAHEVHVDLALVCFALDE